MRIIFMGTPEFAVPSLEALSASEDEVVAVVCRPDRPAGRGQKLRFPAAKIAAAQRRIPVLQPPTLRTPEVVDRLGSLRADLMVVAAYGKILPALILALPGYGCINVHGSLLPKYRGAAPIQWAIYRGETVTGVTIMQMNERMDAGDILLQRETAIGASETAGELELRLAQIGAAALTEVIAALRRGALQPRPQVEEEATLAPMIKKTDGRIDWNREAVEIERQVRAFNPWPSAFTMLSGRLLRVHRAAVVKTAGSVASPGELIAVEPVPTVACGAQALCLEEVQVEGRRRLPGAVFARGARLSAGDRLG